MAQERYIEFIRGLLSWAASPADWGEVEVRLPVSENELMAVLIHEIVLQCGFLATGTAAETHARSCHMALRSAPAGTVWDPWNVGVLASHLIAIERDVADVFGYINFAGTGQAYGQQSITRFDPPVLVSQNVIYFAGGNFDDEVLASYAGFRIGYTIEKVSREAFIAALVRFL